ncbi:MAG: FtsX-like permease family protein [Candidatus Neomarinimicrobiota bacterium]
MSLKLALRYIFSIKRKSFSSYASFLSIAGLSIGIMALVLTSSIINGFEEVVSEKLSSFHGYGRMKHIFNNSINTEEKIIKELKIDLVNVEPYINHFSLIRLKGLAEGVLIEGVERLPKSIIDYKLDRIYTGEIILGSGLSNSLKCKVGDNVYLQPLESKKIRPFKVKYIFNSGIQEFDKLIGYINIKDAKKLFNTPLNHVSGYILKNNNFDLINKIQYPYFYESWKEKHSLLFEWISIQRLPAYIMFGLIALVGLVNVLAALTMIIIEKSSQIGILYAQGIQKKQLNLIFMMNSGFIGLLGSFFGGCGSLIVILIQTKFQILKIPADIYFMDRIPFSFDFLPFFIITLIVVLFCVLTSLWPVKVATNISPREVLRYE